MNRAVFLDRDGTLVKTFRQTGLPDRGPRGQAEIEYLPGVVEGCQALKEAGVLLVGITNQPDVGRGIVTDVSVELVNATICGQLRIRAFYCCRHKPEDQCLCRKPLPGLIFAAAYELGISSAGSFVIGDSEADRLAAKCVSMSFLDVSRIPFSEAVECVLKTCK